MGHFDDLPRRDRNRAIEEKAEAAFQKLISQSEDFIFQGADRMDYGTDCQIEVVQQNQPTNVRIHVQLKGTESVLNTDGSVSIEISRTNLNYLLAQPHSFYVCYHVPSDSLRVSFVENVLRQYEHNGTSWTEQKTLTVNFAEVLTVDRLKALAALARSSSASSRDRRIEQVSATVDNVPGVLKRSVAEIHVPENTDLASQLLEQLYENGADANISAAFDTFGAVLGLDHDAMGFCYMAEINLGMAGRSQQPGRIEDALTHFESRLEIGRYQVGSLHYAIGNTYSALGREEEAKTAYEAAFDDPAFANTPVSAAQCYKNLGTSLERLGDEYNAAEFYRKALGLNPDLPEAHNALGNHHHRHGRYEEALDHYDQVIFTDRELGRASTVAGWRVNIHFILGDGPAAFREINRLIGSADKEPWIWPWCARQVAGFGRTSVHNARLAVHFWQRYLRAHPEVAAARRELLLTSFYLRAKGENIGKTYAEFSTEFDSQVNYLGGDDAALAWDRLGHWAQDEGNWAEAERCFRRAYELEGGYYGYCLGTALNFLDRFEESLPLLLEQAQVVQADAMSWFQVGLAYEKLERVPESIDAYKKALMLDPDYDLAMFNLGGVLWNSGDREQALLTWRGAVEQYPDHEFAARLRRELFISF